MKTTKRLSETKKAKALLPGFAFCNQAECTEPTTYMREHGKKIAELFGRDETENCIAWQSEVLEELIAENQNGFFVTDLEELRNLAVNLFRQVQSGKTDFIPYFQQIISLSMVPFRKMSNGDDRTCLPLIGGFFESLCPIIKLGYPELQLEAARAISWFSKCCGPLNPAEDSTFINFYPPTDAIPLYCFVPTGLHVETVIKVFVDTFTEVLESLNEREVSGDVLALCFRSLFEFVKRGQSKAIPAGFVLTVLNFIVNHSELKIATAAPTKPGKNPACSIRVMAIALLFFDAYIQESKEAMAVCATQSFVGTLWSLFVESLFTSFKNVQKRIRNELLGCIMLIMRTADAKDIEKNLLNKMFDLLQSVAMLVPDVAVSVAYSTKNRQLRITHDPVDIQLILLAQDYTLILHQKTELPDARNEYIEHQINVLRGNINKYLVGSKETLVLQALQLLHAFVRNIEHFVQFEGPEVLMQMIVDPIDDQTLFYVLLLVLAKFSVFKDETFVTAVMQLRRDNDQILAVILALMAVLMQGSPNIVEVFMKLDGLNLLKSCISSDSAEVVLAAIDCARSIAPTEFENIDQRLVFMLLDAADAAPALIRYAFVGLFLDLLQYESFIKAALLWKSLKTNSNLQRTIVRWWRDEEERLDIRYDKCIIIDIDKPLDGHPLAGRTIKKREVDRQWLLDKNSLSSPTNPYKLDFRARLFLLLRAFPELNEADCKPTDKIKELMIRQYDELKRGGVWQDLRMQLDKEEIKPLHDDKAAINDRLERMRELSLNIQERQCEIWQKCEDDRLADEQRTYNQLNEGLKTAQYVAENYKAIMASQPLTVARPYQGRTVKGEDVLVRSGNLRTQQKQEIMSRSSEQLKDDALRREKEMEETYINDCLQDESISYLVQLMKNSQEAQPIDVEPPPEAESASAEE